MYLGLLNEPIERTLARLHLLKHMTRPPAVCPKAVAALHNDAARYERMRSNQAAQESIISTLLSVGSRRMEACLRGDHWLTSGFTA